MRLSLLGGLLLGLIAMFGCCNRLSLKSDVFQNQPLWLSAKLGYRAAEKGRPLSPKTIKWSQAPGLYNLVAQVLGPEDTALDRADTPKGPMHIATANLTVENETDPLPAAIAALPVTKALVASFKAAYLCQEVPDMKLGPGDFRGFAEAAFKTAVSCYQDGDAKEGQRLRKLARFSLAYTAMPSITWQAIATSYFTAYYKGNFVDRTGGTLSKPAIGMKIPNETITSALTVFLEATCDYALLRGETIGLRDPIIYDPSNTKQPYMTKDGAKPTLVEVIQKALGKDPSTSSPQDVETEGVIEPLEKDDTKVGITQDKLDTIRLVSGLASDVSGACGDLITRTFGGIHIGIVVLGGKLSIGDNDTLAKIVQTTVDVMTKRVFEAATADYLYYCVKTGQRAAAKGIPGNPTVAEALGYTEP